MMALESRENSHASLNFIFKDFGTVNSQVRTELEKNLQLAIEK